MPRRGRQRNFHNPGDDVVAQPPSTGNRDRRARGRRWSNDVAAELPLRIGHYPVSIPGTNPFLETDQHYTMPAFDNLYRQRRQRQQPHNHFHDNNRNERKWTKQSQQRAEMFQLKSLEFKAFLLQAFEEGKRRLDEWMSDEDGELSASTGRLADDGMMDWQPENTIIIPQAVTIRYPWDVRVEPGMGRWRRRRSGLDDMLDGEMY